MAQEIIQITDTADDSIIVRDEIGVYPPQGGGSHNNTHVEIVAARGFWGGNTYQINNAFLRFNTSVLSDDAVITAATLNLIASGGWSNQDSKSVLADYFAWDGTSADYSQEPPPPTAVDPVPIADLSAGAGDIEQLTLKNPCWRSPTPGSAVVALWKMP
jgi:hypothetical protein